MDFNEVLVNGGATLALILLIQVEYTIEQLIAAGGILVFLFAIIIWVVAASRGAEEPEFFQKQASKAQSSAQTKLELNEKEPSPQVDAVRILRGGAFVGNRLRFKVKVVNESQYTITDIKVYLVSYPRDALKFDAENDDIYFSKIEPGGFRSPAFEFLPTQDCVKGEILAGVTYIDTKGEAHTHTTRPFSIRAVCDLLVPEQISPEEFRLTIQGLHSGELAVSVDKWTAEEMYDKALLVLENANFHGVSSAIERDNNIVSAKVEGWARGKYTEKGVGVQLLISGPIGEKGACCTIRVAGEDSALVLPAIEDLRSRLTTWLCPRCRSTLSVDIVNLIRKGEVIECPYCGTTVGL
jgi:DNA-directed RNA polymerase subunit RPC12/RpoP